MVAGPLFVVGLLLYLANRRVNDQLAADAATSTDLATGEQAEDPTRHGNADSGETSQ